MPEASTTIRPKVNTSKFMGASFAAGSALEERVGTNERKITLLKNIIKTRKSNVDKKIADGGSGFGLDDSIQRIANTVTSISETLKNRHKFETEQAKEKAQDDEKKGRTLKEKLSESFKGVTKVAQKVLAPVQDIFSRIIGILKKLILGKIVLTLFDWLRNPENQGKVKSIVRFFKDWWPLMLAGYIAFGTAFIPLVTNLVLAAKFLAVKITTVAIPAMIKAAAAMGPWGWATLAILGTGGVVVGAHLLNKNKKDDKKDDEKVDEKPDNKVTSSIFNIEEEFNSGGVVRGRGGVDNVPAKLTAGEFVMSKGAVQKWGVGTLEGMNAAGGGTNRPAKGNKFNGGGLLGPMPDSQGNVKEIEPNPEAMVGSTAKANHFGSDRKENRFSGPAGPGGRSEAYFLQIPKNNPDAIEIWNEEFLSDKFIGTLSRQSRKVDYNKNWWGGARDNEKQFFDKEKTVDMVIRRADDLMAGRVTLDANTTFDKAVVKAQAGGKELALGPGGVPNSIADLTAAQRRESAQNFWTGGDSGGAKIPEINPAAKVSKQKMKVLGINV